MHFEPGRSIVAPCGSLIARVLYVKQGTHKQFAIIDGSMTELVRPAMYRAYHRVENITSNEPFFQGHFPQEPVMPGVLQIEAMAQCGGLLVLNTLEEPERWSTYFMKIDDVKFRQKVVPGDTLLFKVDLLAPVRHGISSMKGYIFVGDRVVAEATFTAQIVKNK